MAYSEEYTEKDVKPARRKKKTRAVKVQQEEKPQVKEKFVDDLVPLPTNNLHIEPRGENQKRALSALKNGKQINYLVGVAGTGKSLLAAYHASNLIRAKKIDKVYLVRPAVSCGKSNGLIPGDLHSKLLPWFLQTIAHFESFLGKGFTKYCLDKKIIELCAAEYMRGMSFQNCVVITEESQNFSEDEFEMMLTRIGENCQMIFTGDQSQHDMRGTSGLVTTLSMLEEVRRNTPPKYLDSNDIYEFVNNISIVKFTFEDVQRSPMVKALTKLYYYKG